MDPGNAAQWVSAVVAVVAIVISVASWRRTNRQDSQAPIDGLKKSVESRLADQDEKLDAIAANLSDTQQRVAKIEAAQEHGITRDDIDKLHERINVLVKESGAHAASIEAQGTHHTRQLDALTRQFDRLDTFIRSRT